ncbi:tetratricopeptide repeat protein [Pendulispora albinea]|uniref:Tetratricopeptide repeat protein n=1 Tax=Pendulispora albinea TaxID=2741071 RepID=A0ABZ2LT04_9BACT
MRTIMALRHPVSTARPRSSSLPTRFALLSALLLTLGFAACAHHDASRSSSDAAGHAAIAAPPTRKVRGGEPDFAAFERHAGEAWALYRKHDDRGAMRAYERALGAKPDDEQVLYRLAAASLRAGETAAARRWLGRLADTGSDLVPTLDQFQALETDAEFRAIAARMIAQAARHRRAAFAFRVPERGLLAEAIAYDPVEPAFYVGSATRRKIVKYAPGNAPRDFVSARPDLDAIGGIRVDASRRRLWAVSGTDPRMDGFNAAEAERNALAELDLGTGALVGLYRLDAPGEHGLNDVAVDAKGRPFATDTSSGQIYTMNEGQRALVPLFDVPPFAGPNGIAFDDQGTTLFVADATGLHRIDVAARKTRRLAQPTNVALGFIDGLYFARTARGPRLLGVQSGAGPGRVVSVSLNAALDEVTGLEILESNHPSFDGPTTGAIVGPWLYIIANSQLWVPREPRETIVLKVPLDPSTPAR